MVGSSETPSIQDRFAQLSLLTITPKQNLILDLDPLKCDSYMLPIIECFKYSCLVKAMTTSEIVLMPLLSKAYSYACYIKEVQRITFEVHDRKTSITKSRFCSLLGLAHTDDMVDPDSVFIATIMKMFFQMGYKETLTTISKFWKANLPLQWNWLFTRLFKSFFERVTCSDCAIFHTTHIIIPNNSKFSFVGFIPKAVFRDVPAATKILEAYRKLQFSGFYPLTDDMQTILEEDNKPKKGGKKKVAKEDTPTTSHHEVSQPISTNPEVTFENLISIPITNEFIEDVSITSPTATLSTPISISPCPPVSLGVSGDDDDFAGFTYNPFNNRTESDDEDPVTQGKLKAINDRLDSLLQSSKASSTEDYSQATIKSFLETLMNEHSANLEKTNKAVNSSASVCIQTTEKVDKLITDTCEFMEKFQSSLESNTTKANEVISYMGSTLKTEKAKLLKVHTGLQSDHVEFNSSISLKITKLQDKLAIESKIMDVLAVKTERVKVLTVKLKNSEKRVNDLLSKKVDIKSCIIDVNGLLSEIIETRDSMITITVTKHFVEKLMPVFAILN
ncbi:unnamed protein product [Lactuca saligna]|uniref:Uncharacterized protein n=1 Tax=Lactuca saligna TaxID=75948 RepID=A0AA35ZHC1_LACSI|nr:unnamed protein product [Lactuca saligna]